MIAVEEVENVETFLEIGLDFDLELEGYRRLVRHGERDELNRRVGVEAVLVVRRLFSALDTWGRRDALIESKVTFVRSFGRRRVNEAGLGRYLVGWLSEADRT